MDPLRSREIAKAWVALLVAVAALTTLLVACGSSPSTGDATPGADTGGRPIDTTPFTMAGPNTTTGPTTSPTDVDYRGPGRIAPQPTSTTTLPLSTVPALPGLEEVTSICGFERTAESFNGLNFDSPEEAQALLTGLVEVMEAYRDVAPTEAQDDLSAIIPTFENLRDVMAANGWDSSTPPVEQAVEDIGSGPFAGRITRIVTVERATCE